MFDIRDHGGGYGGGRNEKALSLYDVSYIDDAFLRKNAINGGYMFGQRRMANGYTLSVREEYSGYTYSIGFVNEDMKHVVETTLILTGGIYQQNPLSMVCKLPDNTHIVSHNGNLYRISSDLKSVTKVVNSNTYGTGSGLVVVLMFISKATGHLVVFNSGGYAYLFDADTLTLVGSPPHRPIQPITSYAHSQIVETPNSFIIKSGDSQGTMINVNKYVQLTQQCVIFEGHSHGSTATTWDLKKHVYTNAGSSINKYNIDTMDLVATYSKDLSYMSQGLHYDKVGNKIIAFGYGNAIALDLNTGVFLPQRKHSALAESVALYGYDDPERSRIFIRGFFMMSSISKTK